MDNKQKAQQRADQIHAFYDEAEQLEAEQGLKLDAEQFESVVSYHKELLKSLFLEMNSWSKSEFMYLMIPVTLSLMYLSIKYSHNGFISSGRSRSGGIVIGKTESR